MVEIVTGENGKGKTKILINKANDDIKLTNGTIVYLDKNNKHMYELSNRVRLINVPDYNISDFSMFLGFLYGIVACDHDLDKIYLDNFIAVSLVDENMLSDAIIKLNEMSEKFGVDFILSIAKDQSAIPTDINKYITVAL